MIVGMKLFTASWIRRSAALNVCAIGVALFAADKIAEVTQQRQKENLELPVEVTRSQLTKARVVQRILQLESREDELEVFLRSQTGLADNTPIEVSPEELPGEAEQEGGV